MNLPGDEFDHLSAHVLRDKGETLYALLLLPKNEEALLAWN